MRKRVSIIVAIAALAALSCLMLSGCGTENMDEGTRKTLGLALGLMIVAASGIGFLASGHHFGRKRQQNARKNRQRAKQKRKR